jgi:hypothetical protein
MHADFSGPNVHNRIGLYSYMKEQHKREASRILQKFPHPAPLLKRELFMAKLQTREEGHYRRATQRSAEFIRLSGQEIICCQ